MLLDKDHHKKMFIRSLEKGGCFRSRVATGESWPKNIYARRYTLKVTAVTDEAVTFSVASADVDPRDRSVSNPLEHGVVPVIITDNINEVIRTALRASDPKFFETYTPISNDEDRRRYLENGIQFSEGYQGPRT